MSDVKLPVLVIGGTEFDSEKGARLISEAGFKAKACAMSASPDEQTALYKNPEELVSSYGDLINKNPSSKTVLFCNSLSFALYKEKTALANTLELTKTYKELLVRIDFSKTAIMVAESSMNNNLRAFVHEEGIGSASELNIFENLELVKAIEKAEPEKQLEITLIEINRLKALGYTEVLFGCTHFDHHFFSKNQALKIHQPGLMMINRLFED